MTTLPPAAPATITWDIKFGEKSRRFSLFDTPLGKYVCHEVFSGKSYPQMQFSGEFKTIVARVPPLAGRFLNDYHRLHGGEPHE